MSYAVPASWRLIQTQSAANVASINFTTGIDASYNCYALVVSGLQLDADGSTRVLLRVSTDGGSTYDTGSNYFYTHWYYGSDSSQDWNRSASDTFMFLGQQSPDDTTSTDNGAFLFYLYNLASSSQYKAIHGQGVTLVSGNVFEQRFAGGYKSATAVNAFQVYGSNGNIIVGKFSLYGINP